jgi:hypothetical protein
MAGLRVEVENLELHITCLPALSRRLQAPSNRRGRFQG